MVIVYKVNTIVESNGRWSLSLEARYQSAFLKQTFITAAIRRKKKKEILIIPDEYMNLILFAYNRLISPL